MLARVKYQRICALVSAEQAEHGAALLGLAGHGVELLDGQTIEKPPPGRVGLVVWAPLDGGARALAEVRALLDGAGVAAEVSAREADEEAWRDAWKAYFKPRPVGPFVLVPSWERYAARPGETVIALDPGRAFGTGGHPSTRLCLRALGLLASEASPVPAGAGLGSIDRCARFLDVGCGSGVLAIACALRWPAARGAAVDVLPEAVEVTRENARANGVADRIDARARPLAEVEGRFDVICANIQADVIAPLGAQLAARLDAGGRLIASGLLQSETAALEVELAAHRLRTVAALDEEEWRALVMEIA